MPPPGSAQQTLLSPAELSNLHSSLSLATPIRPDLRKPTDFRPLTAETDILPSTNGSARVCFSDGTEAIAGVKAEVERTPRRWRSDGLSFTSAKTTGNTGGEDVNMREGSEGSDDEGGEADKPHQSAGTQATKQPHTTASNSWLELSIDIPSLRDDDPLPSFLNSMLTETLLSSPYLKNRLVINRNWHWKMFIDILLLSPPLSYPLPLLSLTTHLALLNALLPQRISEVEDDPLWNDDWDAAVPLYPRETNNDMDASALRPPVTLLVMCVGENILFDPSREELAVAESVVAVSFVSLFTPNEEGSELEGKGDATNHVSRVKIIAMRMIDPPSRLTPLGVSNSANPAAQLADGSATSGLAGGSPSGTSAMDAEGATAPEDEPLDEAMVQRERGTVWSPPRGGLKRGLLTTIIKLVTQLDGVVEDVLEGLAGVET